MIILIMFLGGSLSIPVNKQVVLRPNTFFFFLITKEPPMAEPFQLSVRTQALGCWPRPPQPTPGNSGHSTNGRNRTQLYGSTTHPAFTLTNWTPWWALNPTLLSSAKINHQPVHHILNADCIDMKWGFDMALSTINMTFFISHKTFKGLHLRCNLLDFQIRLARMEMTAWTCAKKHSIWNLFVFPFFKQLFNVSYKEVLGLMTPLIVSFFV